MSCIISVEGLDGAGKSSLIAGLQEGLSERGRSVAVGSRKRPLRLEYGRRIRTVDEFPDAALSLFWGLASAYDILTSTMVATPADVVILDRYSASPLSDAIAAGMDRDRCLASAELLPTACLTLLVDVSPDVALARRPEPSYAEAGGETWLSAGTNSTERFLAYQSAARAAFLELSADSSWVLLDGTATPRQVVEDAFVRLDKHLAECSGRP
jgi:thymidylate kinase